MVFKKEDTLLFSGLDMKRALEASSEESVSGAGPGSHDSLLYSGVWGDARDPTRGLALARQALCD